MRRHPSPAVRHQAQRGGIALIFVLLMVPLMGFMGLAVDMSRIYINRTELQGAADACALSAALHLRTNPVTAAAFTGATNGGRWVATLNRTDLQSVNITNGNVTVEFGTSLGGGTWNTAATAVPGASLVRCTIRRANLDTWFLKIGAGHNRFQISAEATATIPAAGSTNCGASTGNCNQAPGLVF